jgi:LEA14-like dessication related protein
MKKSFFAVAGWFVFAVVFGCKTPPEPPPPPPLPPDPSVLLRFTGINALDIDHVSMEFQLLIENPRTETARADIERFRVEINGREPAEGIQILPGLGGAPLAVKSAQSYGETPGLSVFPFKLELNLAKLTESGLPLTDDYNVKLTTALGISYGGDSPIRAIARESAVFPRIRRPVFTITDIAVLQAELINTLFRVNLKVENPNPFPVELSAFQYELYGSGRFWAGGREKNILRIPPRESAEAKLFLVMNFINMKRDLLDQVIAFENVRYRFAGEALVSTGIEYLPQFRSSFDLSGLSEVYE